MKRLVKKSLMNPEMFKGTLDQLGNQGREILKLIEDYKFKLEQTARLLTNDQQLAQKVIQKKKQLDIASGQIYSIVFDVENLDITQAYEQQQINTNPNMPSPQLEQNLPQSPINDENNIEEEIDNVDDDLEEELEEENLEDEDEVDENSEEE